MGRAVIGRGRPLARQKQPILDGLTQPDAVAGVVNIQTRQGFEGLTLEGQVNAPTEANGNGGSTRLSVVAGAKGDVSFSAVLDGYTKLQLDLELAEKSYSLALAGVEAARSKAEQDNRYLATFVQPGLPQTATRPRRAMIIGLAACFIFIAWLSAVLIALSNRDRTA